MKQYAFVSVINYSSVGVGESIGEAMRDYAQVLRKGGSSIAFEQMGEPESILGRIERIASEQADAALSYKMILQEEPECIFIADSALSEELALTQPGDRVELQFIETGTGIVDVTAFDNLEFVQKK